MIIDINKRQSGKTTRLIDNALRRLENNEKSIIITYNTDMSKYIMGRIRKEIVDRDIFGKFLHHPQDTKFTIANRDTTYIRALAFQSCTTQLIGLDDTDYMFHYDEFDFYINEIEPYFLKHFGYYCSTPSPETVSDQSCLIRLIDRVYLHKGKI